MPIVRDPRYTQSAVAGGVNTGLFQPSEEQTTDSALDVLAAAARQSHLAGAGYARLTSPDPDMPDSPIGWDALDHIKGYEQYADRLADAATPGELQGRLDRIRSENQDKEVLHRAGLGGTAANLAFGVLDPSFLIATAVPEIAGARILSSVVRGAAGAAVYEANLQALQEQRSATESLLNVAGGAVISGVLGRMLHAIPPSESAKLREAVDREAQEFVRSEAGAAAVARPTTLAEESIAPGAAGLSKGLSKTPLIGTDLDIVMNADSVAARTAMQDLADVPQVLGKNLEGVATPTSVEAAVVKHEARVADFIDLAREKWVAYRQRVPSGERMKEGDFYTAIASSARRGDNISIPEVDEAAKFLRAKVFDPLKDDAQKLGLMVDPVAQAQQRAAQGAVDAYFKAQEKQLFADYQARTRAAVKEGQGLEGDAADVGHKSGAIQTELQRALDVEEGISTQTMQDLGTRLDRAQGTFDATVSGARRDLDDTFAAAKSDAEARAAVAQADAVLRADQTALGEDLLKRIRQESIDRANAKVEAAVREQAKSSREARETLKRDKARIEILKGRLKVEAIRKEAAKAIREARKQYNDDLRKVRAQYSEAAPTGPRDTSTGRALKDFKRTTSEARKALVREREQVQREMRTERNRVGLARRKLKKGAAGELEKLGPDRLKEFRKRAESAMFGEADPDATVNEMARLMRAREAGDLKGRVTLPKVDADRVRAVQGAESYFRRMYDREAIRANLTDWYSTLTKWFARDSNVDPAEIKAAVEDVTKKILGADVGQANYGTKITVSTAGPLKERTLDIPDELIEKFLVNDPVKVARSYVRDLAPQVELAKRFGDVDMKQRAQSISDEYNILREKVRQGEGTAAAKSKKLDKLAAQEKETLDALLRVRNRILGRAGKVPESEGGRRAVAAARGWRNLVAAARLGGTAVTGGVMDTAKIAAQYGFMPTINKLVHLTTSKAFRELSRTQARRVGAAVEVALARRVQAAYEGAVTEGWSEKLANGVYKYTGLNHATDFNRTLAASLFEDRVLKAAAKVAEGKELPKFERASLASLGLGDDEMKAIAEQVAKHGGEVDGIHVSGSADWTDKNLADIYDAAILKESRIAVQQPGAADRVWWMDSETGKLIGQLKSFALSGPTRLLAGGLQMAGQREFARAARYFGFMMMGGYLTHAIRQVVAGKQPTTDPRTAAFEAFTESGIGGVMPDLLSPLGRRLGVFGESVRYSDRNALSAYGGPALGAANDVYDFAFNRTQGGLSASDLHMFRRMLPYNNVWWLRREINALEGELAESLDLKGADTATFAQRMMRTDAVLAAKKRGGTGTQIAQAQ